MFKDRTDAGRQLAERLVHLAAADTVDRDTVDQDTVDQDRDVVVLGLPRGGVPVAYEVAGALGAPLDVILVRKLGVPSQPELGMGAIGEDGRRVINSAVIEMAEVTEDELATVEAWELVELGRRAGVYRRGRPRVPLAGRVAIIIDDGIATGSTARAACEVARAEGARRVILAVPVAPPDWRTRLAGVADELIAVRTPDQFRGIGQFYGDFTQVSDEEVVDLLDRGGPNLSRST